MEGIILRDSVISDNVVTRISIDDREDKLITMGNKVQARVKNLQTLPETALAGITYKA
ncbi:hypothetical protein ACFLUP_00755 [Chloroflexota bacterium]